MAVLSVNLNKIALIRNSRDGVSPSVVKAARTVISAGAHGITVHPRPDQRHIRPSDVSDLAKLLVDYQEIEFNIEGNPFAPPRGDNGYPGFDALIESALPQQATLVPDSDGQLTSDHGWDLTGDNKRLRAAVARYQNTGARVSLFMDPDVEQIARVRDYGADRIELYTGPFAATLAKKGLNHADSRASLSRYLDAARYANQAGLGVNAGHDLDLTNLILFREISEVAEVSIGHALIIDALEFGLAEAVNRYLAALSGS
ncbi:MAG: pyridoxine 5'-phosphate synthase [Gammaproteobacteria bacterium]|nr:pyridoxine 5'-phosphate synthase [Gammaproteobacteria bacterium]